MTFGNSFRNLVTAKSLSMSMVFVQPDNTAIEDAQLETIDAVVRDVS